MHEKTLDRFNKKIIQIWPSNKQPEDVFGLEIEVEGQNLPRDLFQYWMLHDDGSLRGNDNSEYVLRSPLNRKECSKALAYLEEKLKAADIRVDQESSRTSVHVHLNFQHKTLRQVFIFWTLWAVLEDLSFIFAGPERRGNLFCLRIRDAESVIADTQKNLEVGEQPWYNPNQGRYVACNLCSLRRFGSIEIRTLHGTIDKAEIEIWLDFLEAIVKAVDQFKTPPEVIEQFSLLGPIDWLRQKIKFPKYVQQKILEEPEARKYLWEGMRLAQDIAYMASDWGENIPAKAEQPQNYPIVVDDLGLDAAYTYALGRDHNMPQFMGGRWNVNEVRFDGMRWIHQNGVVYRERIQGMDNGPDANPRFWFRVEQPRAVPEVNNIDRILARPVNWARPVHAANLPAIDWQIDDDNPIVVNPDAEVEENRRRIRQRADLLRPPPGGINPIGQRRRRRRPNNREGG